MSEFNHTSQSFIATKAGLCLFLLVLALTGLVFFCWFSPEALRAGDNLSSAGQDSIRPDSIRLGLPDFAVENQPTPAKASAKLPAAFGKPAARSAQIRLNHQQTSHGIQISPRRPSSAASIEIKPRDRSSQPPFDFPRSSALPHQQGQDVRSAGQADFYHPASRPSQPPMGDSNDKSGDFWKNVVEGQASQLTSPLPQEAHTGSTEASPSETSTPSLPRSFPSAQSQPSEIDTARPLIRDPSAGHQGMPMPESGPPPIPQFDSNRVIQPPTGLPSEFSAPAEPSQRLSQDVVPEPFDMSNLGVQSFPSETAPPVTSGHSFHAAHTAQPGTSGFRATVEKDANQWMSPYSARADLTDVGQPMDILPALPELPDNFQPWWDGIVRQPVNPQASTLNVDVSNLLQDAVLYSPQVIAIQSEPEVKYRIVTQEAAKFDWTAFLESTYNDLNDPVGNELTTGNDSDRLLTRKWRFSGGLRRKNEFGGELQVTQDFGHENQNSIFFIPNNQASSRLELSYRQPLLDGAGRVFNQSEIVLARIAANTSEDDVVDALQDHLIDVTTAYWTLYRSRSEFFQKQKLLISSQDVLVRLKGRGDVDAIPRQILRAEAAVARAKTGIRRTLARVKDAEAQLRLLVNSPGMLNGGPTELLPFESPKHVTETADLRSILQTALYNRADISGAIRDMRSAGVRLGVSQQQLLPRLDLLVSGYVSDLAASSKLGAAYKGQFNDNRPGYTLGFEFELPVGNRAARARHEQRQWELKRAISIFRATVEKSLTDVEISRREVATAHAEMISRYHSMQAANQESSYLKDRFEVFPEAEDSATLLLEDLLSSFERVTEEESAFVRGQVDHALALVGLKKQMGTLLRSRHDRPAIDTAQRNWVQGRIQSHVPHPEGNQDADVGPSKFESPSPAKSVSMNRPVSAGHSPRMESQTAVQQRPPTAVQRISHRTYDEPRVTRQEPIPRHHTVWKRSPLND